MPRNSAGTYTLPAGNPVVAGTTIDASWANDTMSDMANEITNSLSRTGAGGMLAPFRVADGSVTAPGLGFTNETNSGLYRAGTGELWFTIGGVAVAQITGSGLLIPSGKRISLPAPVNDADAANKEYVDDQVAPVVQYADLYLGSKSSDPTTNNSGGALVEGVTYWSSTLEQMRVYNGTNWVPMPTISSVVGQTFSGDGVDTTFTLANPTGDAINLEVFISGVRQVPTSDYSVSGTTLTFVTAPPSGTDNIFVRYAQLGTITEGAGSIVYTPAGTGAVATTVQSKLRETVSVLDFGADPTGVADSTAAIQAAVTYAISVQKSLEIPDGSTFAVNTFGTALDDATNCAIKITGNLILVGSGTITSSTGAVTNSVFGIDGTSGSINFAAYGIKFAGAARYRAIYATTASNVSSICVREVETTRQSILLIGQVSRSITVFESKIGTGISAGTAVSPTLNVTIPAAATATPEFKVNNNTVWTGTEVISTGAFVIHGMPVGGECIGNTHFNIGPANNEGFDIDNIGKFAKFVRNTSWGAGFEYKTGTEGYSDSRDIIFSENISYSSWGVGFAIQSSCIGFGNVAYNPATYGLYMTPAADVDSLLDDAHIVLTGIRIIYAGSSWTNAVKLDAGVKSLTVSDLRIELDPAWNVANPATSMPNIAINIDGDLSNLVMRDVYIDRNAGDGVNFRPTTTASNILFENFRWGGAAGDSCFDLLNCNNVQIVNPSFPATITDRPVRLSLCNAVQITCEYHANITLAQTSGTNTGVLINNWGQEAAGANGRPVATSIWPVGCFVSNTSDGSVWERINASATATTAWKQITPGSVSSSPPVGVTYVAGQIAYNSAPTSGGYVGWVCTKSSVSTTGSITSGATALTLTGGGSTVANGESITVAGAGVDGADLYTTVSSGGGTNNLVLAASASTTVSGAAVTTGGTWKTFGLIS